ncbi:MAG: class I SAM-dependent RNA methyltransferase [Desulfuromonadales bacterium]|nr:class I SAM-dependent RNA methyltransferase [Desulfuromonadales bacterium]
MPASTALKLGTIISPLTVETLVNGGAGLARHDGRVVFIAHAAVGDVVSCRITKVKKKFLVAEITEILQPAIVRRQPECPVAGDCGGCQWQHLPYREQLSWKEQLFRESMVRSGKIDPAKILPIIPAENEWHYRSRVQIKCSSKNGKFVTGFYRPQSHAVVAVEQCPIIVPPLNHLLAQLRSIIDHTPFAITIPQIDLALDDNSKCVAVIHYSGKNLLALGRLLNRDNLRADLLIKSAPKKTLTNIKGSGDLNILVGEPQLQLQYAAGGFAQINLPQNRVLVDTVLSLAELTGEQQVVDLFCGMGNISLPLARQAGQVVGIEESAISIRNAKENGQRNKIDNVEFYCQSATGALRRLAQHNGVDVLVLDPPRCGAAGTM